MELRVLDIPADGEPFAGTVSFTASTGTTTFTYELVVAERIPGPDEIQLIDGNTLVRADSVPWICSPRLTTTPAAVKTTSPVLHEDGGQQSTAQSTAVQASPVAVTAPLANTGARTGELLGLGGVLLIAGGGITYSARRRPNREH